MDLNIQVAQTAPKLVAARVGWCFTVNNPTMTKEEFLDNMSENCKYLVVGFEVGDSGTPHFQGYLELKKKKRFNQMKELFLLPDIFLIHRRCSEVGGLVLPPNFWHWHHLNKNLSRFTWTVLKDVDRFLY